MAAVSLYYGQKALERGQEAAEAQVVFNERVEAMPASAVFAFPEPLDAPAADVQRIPVPETSGYLSFIHAHKGAQLWFLSQEILVQAQEEAVVVTDVTAHVIEKTAPLDGTLLWSPWAAAAYSTQTGRSAELGSTDPASDSSGTGPENTPTTEFVPVGQVTPISLGIDLDSPSPDVREFADGARSSMPTKDNLKGRRYFGLNAVTVAPGEISSFVVTAGTTRRHFRMKWALQYVTSGQARRRVVSHPYAVTAGAGRWDDPLSQPDFASYENLLVLDNSSKKPRWRTEDPRRFQER